MHSAGANPAVGTNFSPVRLVDSRNTVLRYSGFKLPVREPKPSTAGVAQPVEYLLAKEDVASANLVTCSNLSWRDVRLEKSPNEDWAKRQPFSAPMADQHRHPAATRTRQVQLLFGAPLYTDVADKQCSGLQTRLMGERYPPSVPIWKGQVGTT